MGVQLNHHIVWCRDKHRSAAFLTEMLGLSPATTYGPFLVVELENGVSIDYHDVDADTDIQPMHYAFLVTEPEFDEIYGRILERGLDHWADPARSRPHDINRNDGGRGVYFPDPDGQFLEIITRPYGSGAGS